MNPVLKLLLACGIAAAELAGMLFGYQLGAWLSHMYPFWEITPIMFYVVMYAFYWLVSVVWVFTTI